MNNYAEIVRQQVPTSALIASLGIKRNREGFICCPFHGENTPSLRIYEGSRGWCCFGCNASGSVIDFVMRWYGIGYQQALIKLNYDFSLGLPIGRTLSARERMEAKRAEAERKRAQEAKAKQAAEAWQAWETAFDMWLRLERLRAATAPKRGDAIFSSAYAYALQQLPAARDDAEYTQDRLRSVTDRGKPA